jgi:hypothetical protein
MVDGGRMKKDEGKCKMEGWKCKMEGWNVTDIKTPPKHRQRWQQI